jgi:hypothetical protein
VLLPVDTAAQPVLAVLDPGAFAGSQSAAINTISADVLAQVAFASGQPACFGPREFAGPDTLLNAVALILLAVLDALGRPRQT